MSVAQWDAASAPCHLFIWIIDLIWVNWSTSFEWSGSARVLCNARMKADALLKYWHGAFFTYRFVQASFINCTQSAHIRGPLESRVHIYTCCHYTFCSCLHNRNHTRCTKCEALSVWMHNCECVGVCGAVDEVKITSFRLWQSHTGKKQKVLSGQDRPHPVWVCLSGTAVKKHPRCFLFFFFFFCNLFNLVITTIYTEFSLTLSGELGSWKMPLPSTAPVIAVHMTNKCLVLNLDSKWFD